jgi:hypothetical protein
MQDLGFTDIGQFAGDKTGAVSELDSAQLKLIYKPAE